MPKLESSPEISLEPLKYNTNKAFRNVKSEAAATAVTLPFVLDALSTAIQQQAPRQAQSEFDILSRFGPDLARLQSEISKIGRTGQVESDVGLLAGPGRALTQEALNLSELADPEFFALRNLIGQKGSELIAGQDPNKLTEAELANVERASNRSNIGRGLAGSGSNLATVENALTFDTALQGKRARLLETLTRLGGVAPNLKSGAFNFGAATGAGAGNTAGALSGNFASTATQGSGLASNLLGQAGAESINQSNIRANRASDFERVVGALPDYS